jgi:4-hydroxybenzoate polyprenyltransferase
MREALTAARAGDWWSHKLAPLLATGYASCAFAGVAVADRAGALALVFLAVIPGAIFVSVLNDLTDVEADRAAGKPDRLGARRGTAWAVVGAMVAAGIVIGATAFRDDPWVLAAYGGAWLAFALYSAPPVRLKARGVAGAFADAAGASLFPQLLMAGAVLAGTGAGDRWLWLTLVGVWAAGLGLRGALLHQLGDVEADTRAGVRTFARTWPKGARRLGAFGAFPVELAAFAAMLAASGGWLAAALLAPYGLLEWLRARRWGLRVIVVDYFEGSRIVMHDFYLAVYAVAFLVQSSLEHAQDAAVLVVHLLLFPLLARRVVHDVLNEIRIPLSAALAGRR